MSDDRERVKELIAESTPPKPLPYSPELLHLWGVEEAKAWGKLNTLRLKIYRESLPWYGETLVATTISKDAEQRREVEMRADREWSALSGVPAITSFENLEIARSTAVAAGFPASDEGLRAWNLARDKDENRPDPPDPNPDPEKKVSEPPTEVMRGADFINKARRQAKAGNKKAPSRIDLVRQFVANHNIDAEPESFDKHFQPSKYGDLLD